MKTNKLIVITKDFHFEVPLIKEWDLSKEEFIALLKKDIQIREMNILDIADANTHHICKYCGEIAKGTDEDVLCQECRMTFGHAFYSEL